MKRFSVALVVFIGIFAVVSCENSMSPGGMPDTILPGEGAHVRIMLPSAGNARSVADVQRYTDYFHVTFKRTDTETPEFFSASATSGDGYIEMRIPVGQYDILLFAGYIHTGFDTPIEPLILASAYRRGQDIFLEGINEINLTLQLVEFEIAVPSLIEAETAFEAMVRVNFHNPLIDFGGGYIYFRYWQYNASDRYSDYTMRVESIYNSFTGFYIFSEVFVAGEHNDEGLLYFSSSLIKPFGNVYVSDGWHVVHAWAPLYMNRRFFDFRTPEVNINIQWPTES